MRSNQRMPLQAAWVALVLAGCSLGPADPPPVGLSPSSAVVSAAPTPTTSPPAASPTPTAQPPTNTPAPTNTATPTLPPTNTPTYTPVPTNTPEPTPSPPPEPTPSPPPSVAPVVGDEAVAIVRVRTDKPYVAITVDDFYSIDYTDYAAIHLLEAVNLLRAPLTLCPTGYALKAYHNHAPTQLDRIKELINEGNYEICNHTLSHPRLKKLDEAQQFHEISKGEDLVETYWEREVGPFFRPPWRVWTPDTMRAAAQAGYPYVANWTVDTGDWEGGDKQTVKRILSNIACAEADDIILMHANRQLSADALPLMIEQLREAGLEPVTFSTLLESGEPVLMEHPKDLDEVKYCQG